MANYVLEILDGDRAGEVLSVGDATIRIGRKAGNDLVLADEKTSGVHCEIAPEGDRLVLKDLGSTNGTFLDGKRVTELVLTPGDVVTVGRLRVKFRDEQDSAAEDVDAGEFAMRKLDAGRLQKRSGSIGLIALLVLVAAGGGGWFWWQSQQKKSVEGVGASSKQEALVVSGNRLKDAVANCEAEEGWKLRAAGVGFQPVGESNTGNGAFSASRAALAAGAESDAEEEGGGAAAAAPAVANADFAVMELAEPIEVFAGRSLTLAAHVQTHLGAQVALRAKVFASKEEVPFRFCNGTKIAAAEDGWQRLETIVTVPSGCDRLQVEVVAVLPSVDSEAIVDDVSVVDGGSGAAVELAPENAGHTAFGWGSSIAVRSVDSDNPVTVLSVLPVAVPGPLRGLHAAGYCVLSDLGASLACTVADRSVTFAATGVDQLQFVMPAEAAGGLAVAAAAGTFGPAAAESTFSGQKVLFGSYTTRAMLQLDEATSIVGKLGGGVYRLSIEAPKASLVLGFRAERQQAMQYLREAKSADAEGRYGAALDLIAKLFAQAPMDSESLANAQQLRASLLTRQAARVSQLRKDMEEAGFFDTRGGFDRVGGGVEELIALYGEHNVEDLDSVRALRAQAQEQLVALDKSTHAVQRERLTQLSDAFASVSQPGLQKLVQDYMLRHLK